MRKFTAAFFAIAVALPIQAGAKPVMYDCTITKKSHPINWISEKMYFIVGDDGGVRVVDGHILHYNKGPMTAKVRKQGAKLTMTWLLTGLTSTSKNRMPPAQHRAVLDTSKNNLAISVRSSSFDGARIRGTGPCKLIKNPKLPKNFG